MRSTRTRRQRKGRPHRRQPQPRVDRASRGSDEDRRSRTGCGDPRASRPPGHTLEGRSNDWTRWCESTPTPEKALPDTRARPARTARSANAADPPSPDRAGHHIKTRSKSQHTVTIQLGVTCVCLMAECLRPASDAHRPLSRNRLAWKPASPPRKRHTTAIGTATLHQALPVSRLARSTIKHNPLNEKA